jgi:CRISPR/Cas system CSM-associated protein Csm3 (group 7 of RAMP superfamily)
MTFYPAYRGRTVLTLRLRLESPLHVGSGFDELDAENHEVQTIVVDGNREPYIPPTTLKGAIRALAVGSGIDRETVEDVFGTIKAETDKGHPGYVIVSGASSLKRGWLDGRVDALESRSNPGTILSKRTAIDDASGTAEGNKLFQSRMVAPGTIFEMRVTIQRGAFEFTDPGIALLIRALAALKYHGIAVGRGKGDGHGLLKLEAVTKVDEIKIDGGKVVTTVQPVDRWSQQIEAETSPLDRATARYVFTLDSDQPFAVLGPDKKEQAAENERGRNNKLRALRQPRTKDGKAVMSAGGKAEVQPDLPGTSLMGVLRARAEWFARLEALREGKRGAAAEQAVFDCIQPLFGEDADNLKAARAKNSGRTGFAGILRLHRIEVVKAAPPQTIDSVKIDRFSMGPFDSGLFGVEAFPKPKFRIELYLDERASPDDHAFMTAFVAWMTGEGPSSGLMIGHGVNRGFGWFAVKQEGTAA